MLSPDTITALARQLYEARQTRTPLRHFSKQHPEMTIDDGYAIQRTWVADYYGPLGALGCRFV